MVLGSGSLITALKLGGERMMNEEFNLSEKSRIGEGFNRIFYEEDVKEFIRLLKEKLHGVLEEYPGYIKEIDKLAGEKLI